MCMFLSKVNMVMYVHMNFLSLVIVVSGSCYSCVNILFWLQIFLVVVAVVFPLFIPSEEFTKCTKR